MDINLICCLSRHSRAYDLLESGKRKAVETSNLFDWDMMHDTSNWDSHMQVSWVNDGQVQIRKNPAV